MNAAHEQVYTDAVEDMNTALNWSDRRRKIEETTG